MQTSRPQQIQSTGEASGEHFDGASKGAGVGGHTDSLGIASYSHRVPYIMCDDRLGIRLRFRTRGEGGPG